MCQFNVPDGQLSVQAPLCLGTVGQRTSALGARPLGSRSQVAPSLLVQLALLRRASDHLGRHPLKQVHTHTDTDTDIIWPYVRFISQLASVRPAVFSPLNSLQHWAWCRREQQRSVALNVISSLEHLKAELLISPLPWIWINDTSRPDPDYVILIMTGRGDGYGTKSTKQEPSANKSRPRQLWKDLAECTALGLFQMLMWKASVRDLLGFIWTGVGRGNVTTIIIGYITTLFDSWCETYSTSGKTYKFIRLINVMCYKEIKFFFFFFTKWCLFVSLLIKNTERNLKEMQA